MKTFGQKIEGFGFKKAFVVFFAALAVFVAAGVVYAAASGFFGGIRGAGIAAREGIANAREWRGRGPGRMGRAFVIEEDGTAREVVIARGRGPFAGPGFFCGGAFGFPPFGHRFFPGGLFGFPGARGMGLFFLGGMVFRAVFRLLLAAWAYADSARGGKNRVLWPVVVLVAGLVGLVVYLISREHTRGKRGEFGKPAGEISR